MDKNKSDTLRKSFSYVLIEESTAIASLIDSIDYDATAELMHLIEDCKGKIVTTGCGTSGVVARKVVHTLSCTRRPAHFLSPSQALHGGLGAVTENDVMILFSKGGETVELLGMIASIKEIGATSVLVSENRQSELAKQCDLFIEISVDSEPDSFNMLATASILATIAYFDALIITLKEQSQYKKEDFLLVHPGGAVGSRLEEELRK